MGIFTSEEFNSLEELFEHELKDMYDAEIRLTEALPKLAEKADSPALKRAFESHLRETEKHVERLESIFENLGIDAEREKCAAMTGLIKEGQAGARCGRRSPRARRGVDRCRPTGRAL